MIDEALLEAARQLTERCVAENVRLVCAESCTGGLIAATITALPGSSRVLDRAFVTYSNDAKEQDLGVPRDLLAQHGAVSEQVAKAMACGALERARNGAQLSIAVTGVAGPDATPEKPVGLVHIAAACSGSDRVQHQRCNFGNLNRDQIRHDTVLAAFELAMRCLVGTS